MTTDTSKAPERMWRENIAPSRMYPSGGSFYHETMPTKPSVEYVRADIHAAMQARAEKAEATIGLKDALIQEERRVRVRAETARDGLRHVVEGLEAERDALRAVNERLQSLMTNRRAYQVGQAVGASSRQAEIERLREALEFYADRNTLRLPSEGPWGLNSTDFGERARAALERKEGP